MTTKPLPVVLDTDCWNEVDDQYALAWLLRRPDAVDLLGIHAAPFHNERSTGPEDGMLRSYDEILHLLSLAGCEALAPRAKRGAPRYLPDESTPVDSDAARDLIRLARAQSPQAPLHVLAIGAITNVASALLLAPDIAAHIRLIWLGGHALDWADTREFNMVQDIAAARVVYRLAPSLVQLPCMGVVSQLRASWLELVHWLAGDDPLADYLQRMTLADSEPRLYGDDLPAQGAAALPRSAQRAWTRILWDVSAVAWLLTPEALSSRPIARQLPGYDGQYEAPSSELAPMDYVHHLERDAIFTQLFHDLIREVDAR